MNTFDPQWVRRDMPFGLWLIGLIFALVGLFMAVEAGPPLAMVLLFIGIGVTILVTSSIVTLTADRMTRMLKMESGQIYELISLGVEVVKSQKTGFGFAPSL